MALLIDTGILYALADSDDAWHVRARDFLESSRDLLIVPEPVVAEAAYLIRDRLGEKAELAFARSLAAGELSVESLARNDWKRAAELLEEYAFLGLVDAAVAAVAERLRAKSLLTTDRRDFSRLRLRHVESLHLRP